MSAVYSALFTPWNHGARGGERGVALATPRSSYRWPRMTSLKTIPYGPVVCGVRPEMRGQPWLHASYSPRRACSPCLV